MLAHVIEGRKQLVNLFELANHAQTELANHVQYTSSRTGPPRLNDVHPLLSHAHR